MSIIVGERSKPRVEYSHGNDILPSDVTTTWTRMINGRLIDFWITVWGDPAMGTSVGAFEHNTTISILYLENVEK